MLFSLIDDEVGLLLLLVGFIIGFAFGCILLLVKMRRTRSKLVELEKVLFQDFINMKRTSISTTAQKKFILRKAN